jgi:hypothetical protein
MDRLNATLARILWISAAILEAGIVLFTGIALLFDTDRTPAAAILLTAMKLACLPLAVAAISSLAAGYCDRNLRPAAARLVLAVALAFLWLPVLVVFRYRVL